MARPGVPGPPVGCEPFIPIPQGVPAQTAWRGLGAGQSLYSEQPLEGAPTMQCTWELGKLGLISRLCHFLAGIFPVPVFSYVKCG